MAISTAFCRLCQLINDAPDPVQRGYVVFLHIPPDALIKSKKHPEFKERYHRVKSHRGHKKAVIAVCKMLLTAIWNMLSKLESYHPAGFLEYKSVNESKSLTTAQALELLRKRGYVITDDVAVTA